MVTYCNATAILESAILKIKQIFIKKIQKKMDSVIQSLWSLFVMEELCQEVPSSTDCLLVNLSV